MVDSGEMGQGAGRAVWITYIENYHYRLPRYG